MDKIYIGSMASTIDKNGMLWISNAFFNGLFRVDLSSNEIQFVGAFEGVKVNADGLHRGAHMDKADIIFTPLYDQAVRIYHSDVDAYEKIGIPAKYAAPFSKSVKVGGFIYFLSSNGYVLEYDIRGHVLKEDELSIACRQFQKYAGGVFYTSMDLEGISLLQNGGNILFRLDFVKHKAETICIGREPTNFEVGYYGDGLYWFFLKNSQDIVSWNRESGEHRSYKIEKEEWAREKPQCYPYGGMLFTEDGVWISNFNAKTPVYIDKKKQCAERITAHLQDFRVIFPGAGGAMYSEIHRMGKEIFFVPCMGNLLLRCNSVTKDVIVTEMAVPKKLVPYMDEMLSENWRKKYMLEGQGAYSMNEFVKILCDDAMSQKEQKHTNYGRNIFDTVCAKLI